MRIASSRYLLLAQLLLLIGLSLTYVSVIHYKSSNRVMTDFTVIYGSAQAFLTNHTIYSSPNLQSYNEIKGVPLIATKLKYSKNLNSPFTVALTLPFAFLSYQQALPVWSLLSIIAGILATVLLNKYYFRSSKLFNAKLLLVLFAFFPTYINVVYGQLGLFMLLLTTLIWLTARNHRNSFAGTLLGIAIGMKLFFGLLWIFFLLQKRWRLLAWSFLSFVISIIIGTMIFGRAVYHDYIAVLHQVNWYATTWNASWLGMLTRIFSGRVTIIISYFLGIGVLFSLLAYWKRSYKPTLNDDDLGFSLSLILMLLMSPLGWLYYLPILILPACIIYHNYCQNKVSSWSFWSVATAWLFINIPLSLHHHVQPGWINLITKSALGFYGLVLLAIGCLAIHVSTNKPAPRLSWLLILIYLPAYVCIIYVIPQML